MCSNSYLSQLQSLRLGARPSMILWRRARVIDPLPRAAPSTESPVELFCLDPRETRTEPYWAPLASSAQPFSSVFFELKSHLTPWKCSFGDRSRLSSAPFCFCGLRGTVDYGSHCDFTWVTSCFNSDSKSLYNPHIPAFACREVMKTTFDPSVTTQSQLLLTSAITLTMANWLT